MPYKTVSASDVYVQCMILVQNLFAFLKDAGV